MRKLTEKELKSKEYIELKSKGLTVSEIRDRLGHSGEQKLMKRPYVKQSVVRKMEKERSRIFRVLKKKNLSVERYGTLVTCSAILTDKIQLLKGDFTERILHTARLVIDKGIPQVGRPPKEQSKEKEIILKE